jgi:hypothetical protein
MFPPSSFEDRASPTAGGGTTFLRGAMNMETLPDWQRDDMRNREDAKKRNQKEIQDVLKQQIAQKEFERQKRISDQKAEDEKEQIKLNKEQQLLKEKYQREREEQQKKEVLWSLMIGTRKT